MAKKANGTKAVAGKTAKGKSKEWQAFFDQHAREIGAAFDRLGKKATWGAVTRQFPKLSYHLVGVVLVKLGKVKSKEAALLRKVEAICPAPKKSKVLPDGSVLEAVNGHAVKAMKAGEIVKEVRKQFRT